MTVIIDSDAHITEPPDVWTSRMPARYADQIPTVKRADDGRDVWVLDGSEFYSVGPTAPVGYPDYPNSYPPTYDDVQVASYDSVARLKYMDEASIWAQVLYPNVAGFGAQKFLAMPDAELRLQCVSAYNDFLHDWISPDPRRLIANISLPYWDVEASVKEIDRCLGLGGFRGLLFTGEPQRFGMPPLGHEHWNPLFARAEDAGLPIHFHIGGGENENAAAAKVAAERRAAHGSAASATHAAVDLFLKNGVQCADLITSGALNRFPNLKFVSVESGIGWVPFMLETADYTWRGQLYKDRRRDDNELLPSELFARQVYTTTWFEQVAPHHLFEMIPMDRVMFETDYPHTACLYGDIQDVIKIGIGTARLDIQRKVLWDNAAELYNIVDPGPNDKLGKLSDELTN